MRRTRIGKDSGHPVKLNPTLGLADHHAVGVVELQFLAQKLAQLLGLGLIEGPLGLDRDH